MKVLALLWTVCLVRFCSAGCCGCFGGGKSKSKSKTRTSDDDNEPQVTTKPSTPATLDLANPDTSKLDMHTETESGVSLKTYSPKGGNHVSSVVDADKELWKASGDEKCLLAEYYAKGKVELLFLEVENGGKLSTRYFEKVDGAWKEIAEKDFDEKAKTMIGESGKDSTLDIIHPSRLLCKSFDYSFSSNAVQLIVSNKGLSISKLVDGSEDIYTPSSEETLDHTKLYLNRDNEPELILVVTTSSGTSKETYLELKDGKWTVCNNSEERMKGLRTSAEWISNFDMDLSLANSTTECSIFEAVLFGITTRHFYPKPGHLVIGVKDGDKELWKSAASTVSTNYASRVNARGYYCLSCLIYKGSVELLETVVVENNSRGKKHFEKTANGTWKSIGYNDFDKKLKNIKNGVTNPSTPSSK
ncbi:signal peptide containing protein [Theileria equi strain WA]|uniref:Signal peptide containing protein n=1 Tax=Theileria equi strain WA TaxID=1537102 RepID=L1LAN9_THEEQ|nr:signal peptide containing protein [Theileria equi strain WA]EKX72386.1 signal peptide containing protein [Theileria equi strain WA]|eukprot:XP_004831838.1 signal peptide containing protein [Theileria equi strain WA]